MAAQAQAIQDRALTYPCQIPLERNAKGVEELKTKGILVNEVPAAELAKIKDKDKPVVEKYTKLLGATLARTRRASVKLSGYGKFSRESHPFADTQPYVRALIDAFTLDACVWGSDWPYLKATERIDYGPLLKLVERLLPDANDRRKLFWDTPRKLFGFGA